LSESEKRIANVTTKPSGQAVFICDVDYMPNHPGTFYGLVVRTASQPSELILQMYLPTLPFKQQGRHPDQEVAESLFRRVFDEHCVFVFWDGRNDCRVFSFPDNIRCVDLAAPGIWDMTTNYASLGRNGERVERPFTGHHAAQYETEVMWLLLVFLSKHRKADLATVVMSLPPVRL